MDPDPSLFVRIRILPSTSNKKVRKTLISTIFDFLSLKADANVPAKSNRQKKIKNYISLASFH
jgi:hypothetical protein